MKYNNEYNNEISSDFECYLGVRQGESLSLFLFSMYLNGIEQIFYASNINGIDLDSMKLFSEKAKDLREGRGGGGVS